ncbi:exocyst complex component Exo84p [Diutina rugosa]
MDKSNFRKSRAAWGSLAPPSNNPYAHNNASRSSLESKQSRTSTLMVPGQSKRQTRRASIHASATAQAHGRSFSTMRGELPPLPGTPMAAAGAMPGSARPLEDEGVGSILDRLAKELSTASAAEIDEFNKVLRKEEQLVSQQIKTSINENQKQILQLTQDLQQIKLELGHLRTHRKDLWEALTDFRESAERRLEIEQDSTPTHLSVNGGGLAGGRGGGDLGNKRKDRSSVLVLQKMWASELSSLFKHVEGANKYIEAIPGRHVLAESGRWHEVNVGTWKPVKPVHMFVLNDMILMATKKQNMGKAETSKQKLVATHCWPLSQVEFSPIDGPRLDEDHKVYLVNIKHKQLSYVYQTDRLDHFLKINEAFNKARDEQTQSERMARAADMKSSQGADAFEEKRQLRQSVRMSTMFNSDQIASALSMQSNGKQPGLAAAQPQTQARGMLENISARVHQRNRNTGERRGGPSAAASPYSRYNQPLGQGASSFTELKELEDKLDDVDVEIAHNNYPDAVGLICHIRDRLFDVDDRNSATENNEEVKLLVEVVRLKIDSRQAKVIQGLIFDLQNNVAFLGEDDIERIIEYFDTFDELKKGVIYYLNAMSNHLYAIVSRLTVEVQGSTKVDVVNYLSNLVVIYVSIIKRVILVYNRKINPILVQDPESQVDSSGLMNWCIEEMSKLEASVRKYLVGSLVEVVGHNEVTDMPQYEVKDKTLFAEFLSVLAPQLQQLKDAGVNADFKFEDILDLA